MITYTLVVDDLGDGSKLAGVGAGNEQHNAANLHEPPLACRNVNVAHCIDCRRVWIRKLGRSLESRRRNDGGTVPGCVGEVSMDVVAVARFSILVQWAEFSGRGRAEKFRAWQLSGPSSPRRLEIFFA